MPHEPEEQDACWFFCHFLNVHKCVDSSPFDLGNNQVCIVQLFVAFNNTDAGECLVITGPVKQQHTTRLNRTSFRVGQIRHFDRVTSVVINREKIILLI